MKTTIFLKTADLIAQATLLVFTLLAIESNDAVIYFLAGWQLFSAMLHTVFRSAYYHSVHRKYAFILLIIILNIIGAGFILMLPGWLCLGCYGMLLLIPYYMLACFIEIRILERKAVVHLRK